LADVRVRLSAEGVKEVVDGLRQVRTEADLTGRSGAQGFGQMNATLATLRRGMAALGVAISARAFAGIVTGASDAAEKILNLAQSSGSSVENFQALAFQAKQAGVDIEQLARPLGQFAQLSQKAFEGDSAAQKLFVDRLKLTREEIQNFGNQDTVERLEVVSRAFARLPEGPAKATLGVQLFGRQAAALVPILNELGSIGLPAVVKAAKEAGLVLSEDALKGAAALGDELDKLSGTIKVLTIQFVSGLAPSVTTALKGIGGDLASNTSQWAAWGSEVGKVIAQVLLNVAAISDSVGGFLKILSIDVRAISDISAAVTRGNFILAGAIVKRAQLEEQDVQKGFEERQKERFRLLREAQIAAVPKISRAGLPSDPELFGEKPRPQPEDVTDAAESTGKDRLSLSKARLDQETKLIEAAQKLREEAERSSFEQGLTGIRDFYDRRRQIVEQAVNSEKRALLQQRIQVAALPESKERTVALTEIDSRVEQIELQRRTEVTKITNEETTALRKQGDERLSIDRKVHEARGEQHQVRLLEIEEEVRKAEEILNKDRPAPFIGPLPEGAESPDAIFERKKAEDLARTRAALEARAEFERLSQESTLGLGDLSLERSRIQSEAQAGILTQFQAEEQLLALEKERLVVLEALAAQLLAAARATSDPQAIAAAEQFSQSISQVRLSTSRVDNELTQVGAVGLDALRSGLVDLADTGQREGERFSDAIGSMAQSVIGSLKRMAAEILATKLVSSFLGLFGGSAPVPIGPPAPGLAGGGHFSGKGTWKSDSNLVRLSHQEYVVPAERTMAPGMLSVLEGIRGGAITAGDFPGFAEGGLASFNPADFVFNPATPLSQPVPLQGPARGPVPAKLDSSMTVGLEEGLVLRALDTPQGSKVVVRMIEKNRRAIRSLVGG
jgi:hypothetical protein